jgi:peroxisome-assembly ATPase
MRNGAGKFTFSEMYNESASPADCLVPLSGVRTVVITNTRFLNISEKKPAKPLVFWSMP